MKRGMMPEKVRKTYERISKRPDYQKRLREAEININLILSQKKKYKPIILYSGGKDSLVLTHMVMKQDNTIPLYYFHTGYSVVDKQLFVIKRVYDEILQNAIDAGVTDLVSYNTPYCSGEDYLLQDFFVQLKHYKQLRDLNLELLGIRGAESRKREIRVQNRLIFEERKGRFVSFPLRNFTHSDIWAYIVSNKVNYLSHYDHYGRLFGYENSRWGHHFYGFNEEDANFDSFDKIFYPEEQHTVETVETGKKYIFRIKHNSNNELIGITVGGEIIDLQRK